MSGGDGASFTFADYGQDGNPVNPCGDPPSGVGGVQTSPSAEGGALRSQDLRTTGDPAGLDGAVIRVDPGAGAGLPGNPLAASADPNARRIVAHGFRNPFRFTIRPGTNPPELWVGDVGWNTWEELNRIANPLAAVTNFGWPCREGMPELGGYSGLNICAGLRAQSGSTTSPYWAYQHSERVVAGESCPTGSSSISGLAFYDGNSFPPAYDGALFFADYSRGCIWVMFRGANGLPTRAHAPRSTRRRRVRSTWWWGREATSSTPTSAAARSGESTTSPRTSRRPPSQPGSPRPVTHQSRCSSTAGAQTTSIPVTRWPSSGPRR